MLSGKAQVEKNTQRCYQEKVTEDETSVVEKTMCIKTHVRFFFPQSKNLHCRISCLHLLTDVCISLQLSS